MLNICAFDHVRFYKLFQTTLKMLKLNNLFFPKHLRDLTVRGQINGGFYKKIIYFHLCLSSAYPGNH